MAQQLAVFEAFAVFEEDQRLVLSNKVRQLTTPYNYSSGHLMLSSELWRYMHLCVHKHKCAHKINISRAFHKEISGDLTPFQSSWDIDVSIGDWIQYFLLPAFNDYSLMQCYYFLSTHIPLSVFNSALFSGSIISPSVCVLTIIMKTTSLFLISKAFFLSLCFPAHHKLLVRTSCSCCLNTLLPFLLHMSESYPSFKMNPNVSTCMVSPLYPLSRNSYCSHNIPLILLHPKTFIGGAFSLDCMLFKEKFVLNSKVALPCAVSVPSSLHLLNGNWDTICDKWHLKSFILFSQKKKNDSFYSSR